MWIGKVVLGMVKGLGGKLGLPGTMLAHFECTLRGVTEQPACVLETECDEPWARTNEEAAT
jgi:hypothetical protein